jgi:hypothetical protein
MTGDHAQPATQVGIGRTVHSSFPLCLCSGRSPDRRAPVVALDRERHEMARNPGNLEADATHSPFVSFVPFVTSVVQTIFVLGGLLTAGLTFGSAVAGQETGHNASDHAWPVRRPAATMIRSMFLAVS